VNPIDRFGNYNQIKWLGGMNITQHYVSHEGKQMGPYSLGSIVEMVKKNELTLFDYLYDENSGNWVLLMEYRQLADQLEAHKPSAPPKLSGLAPQIEEEKAEIAESMTVAQEVRAENQLAHMAAEWYVLKGENKFGPFSYPDVIRMLQQKVVFEFDFTWCPGLSTWVRIAELDSFKPENIGQLKETLMPEISEVFFRRRYRRVRYSGAILAHDNKSVWKGKGIEISAGGAGVTIENTRVLPGQTLYIHFKSGGGIPPFNAICEVVSKQDVESIEKKNIPIRYGLKFKSISPEAQRLLQQFVKREGMMSVK